MSLIGVKYVIINSSASAYHYDRSGCYFNPSKGIYPSPVFRPIPKNASAELKFRMIMPDSVVIDGKEYIQITYNVYYLKSECSEVTEMVEAIPPKKVTEKAKMIAGAVFATSEDQDVILCANTGWYSVKLYDGTLPAGKYTIKEIDREARLIDGHDYYTNEKHPAIPVRAVVEDENGTVFRFALTSLKKYKVESYPTTYAYSIVAADGSFYCGPDHSYYNDATPVFDTYGKAKKFKDLSKLKAGVMYIIGYTTFTESMEIDNNFNGSKLFDFDPTWRVAKVDKLTNTVVETIDIMPWLNALLRLKPITDKFGGAVRATRKDFESGKYEYPFVAVKKFDLDWEEQPIKVKGTSLVNKKVTPCKIYSSADSVAIACSKAAATKIKFANDGVSIIDLDSLSEFIEE